MPESRLPSLMQPEEAPAVIMQSRLPSLGGSDVPFELPEPPPIQHVARFSSGISTRQMDKLLESIKHELVPRG